MKKLSNKKLLSILCIVVICCTFGGVKLFRSLTVSKVSAAGDSKYDDTLVGEAIANCGTGFTDSRVGLDVLREAIGLEYSFEGEDKDIVKVISNGASFVSSINVAGIKAANYRYIDSIYSSTGVFGDSEYAVVSPSEPLYIKLKLPVEDNADISRNIKISFYLNEDYADKNNNGCVSITSFNELTDAADGENYSDVLALHPTLRDKPDGKDFGTYEAVIGFEVPLKTSGKTTVTYDNPYYNTLCADFRGDSSSYLSDTAIKHRNEVFSFFNNFDDKDARYAKYKSTFPDCNNTKVDAIIDYDKVKETLEGIIELYYKNLSGTSIDSDANLNWFDDSLFNYIRANGQKLDASKVKTQTIELKCNDDKNADFNTHFKSYITDANGKSVYNIKANTDYFYTYSSNVDALQVRQSFTKDENGNENLGGVKEIGKCEQFCEEAVVVDYGPPIASSAGLCFEYQVQITSKIKCTATPEVDESKLDLTLCNPIPICNPFYDLTHQGGPEEEFDACINSCDGGKYTEKCSEKCYNEVYSKPENKFYKQSFLNDGQIIAKKMWNATNDNTWYGDNEMFAGRYAITNGKITWISSANYRTYARYYKEKEFSRTKRDHIYGDGGYAEGYNLLYEPDINGYKRAVHGSSLCNDNCNYYAYGCGQKSYYNDEDLENDKKRLKTEINNFIKSCNAKASCNSTTAKFTISVDYTHDVKDDSGKITKKDEKVTIYFPYDEKSESDNAYEKIKSTKETTGCTGNPDDYFADHSLHTILNYAGCYKNCGDDKAYHTKWSFPGGWRSTKHGYISYEPTKGDSWVHFPDKFCMPADAKAVNEDYFFYYYKNTADTTNQYTSRDFVNAKWPSDKATVYNIVAKARNFGHNNWNFDIKCFYALDHTKNRNVTLRTVDLKDLFPDGRGTSKNNPDGFNQSDDKLPFNWSSRSVPQNSLLPSNDFNAPIYGKYVQTKGYNIYNDDELEYHFKLTPKVMRSINSKGSTAFNVVNSKSSYTKNGVPAYRSYIIREGELKDSAVRVPSESVLGCNNIRNVQNGSGTGECYSISAMESATN